MSDQREVEVHVALVKTTSSWVSLFPSMALNAQTLPPIMRLAKHPTINFPHDPFAAEEITTQEQFSGSYVKVGLSVQIDMSLRRTLIKASRCGLPCPQICGPPNHPSSPSDTTSSSLSTCKSFCGLSDRDSLTLIVVMVSR